MRTRWPALPADDWADTLETLHLYTQIVGKIRMGYGPWLNHAWGVTLYVTPRGFTSGIVPHGDESFEARLDLIDSLLVVELVAELEASVEVDVSLSGFEAAELTDLLRSLDAREKRERPEPFDLDALTRAVSRLPRSVFRVKGFVHAVGREDERVLVQAVGMPFAANTVALDLPGHGRSGGAGGGRAGWRRSDRDPVRE